MTLRILIATALLALVTMAAIRPDPGARGRRARRQLSNIRGH